MAKTLIFPTHTRVRVTVVHRTMRSGRSGVDMQVLITVFVFFVFVDAPFLDGLAIGYALSAPDSCAACYVFCDLPGRPLAVLTSRFVPWIGRVPTLDTIVSCMSTLDSTSDRPQLCWLRYALDGWLQPHWSRSQVHIGRRTRLC
jgi:hypothetical protein